jgi:hypothetical protein
MSGTRVISTASRRELSSSLFFQQGKTPKEIDTILTETLACFLPGRAKDLSAPQEYTEHMQGAEGNSRHSDRNISLFPSWWG